MYLRKKGWKYSADFLEHSLQDNPSDLYYGNKSALAKKLKKMRKVKKKVKKLKKSNHLAKKYSIVFESGDMFGAFHKADLYIDRFEKGTINCVLKDYYDFSYEKYNSFINVANNYEWVCQANQISNGYNITVEMKFKDRKDEIGVLI